MDVFVLSWAVAGLASAVLTYGMTVAHFQRKYPSIAKSTLSDDRTLAVIFAVMSFAVPPLVIVYVVMTGGCKHGFKF